MDLANTIEMATMEEVVVTTHVTTNVGHVTKEEKQEEVEEVEVMAAVDITDPITRDERNIMMKIMKTIDQEDVDLEVEEVVTDQEVNLMAKGDMTIIEGIMGQDQEIVKISSKGYRSSVDMMKDIMRITKGFRRIGEISMIKEIDNHVTTGSMIDIKGAILEDQEEQLEATLEVEEEEKIDKDTILEL